MLTVTTPYRAAAIGVGVVAGLAVFTFGYAKGASYLTDDPEACANCHVMRDHLGSWRRSSHRVAAVCNDCHTPAGTIAKYTTKARNGLFHSIAFTTGGFPDKIYITVRNREVAGAACLKCHEDMVSALRPAGMHAQRLDCLRCHRGAGHALYE
jgi:cytochrome c nitrite reductase small subunit